MHQHQHNSNDAKVYRAKQLLFSTAVKPCSWVHPYCEMYYFQKVHHPQLKYSSRVHCCIVWAVISSLGRLEEFGIANNSRYVCITRLLYSTVTLKRSFFIRILSCEHGGTIFNQVHFSKTMQGLTFEYGNFSNERLHQRKHFMHVEVGWGGKSVKMWIKISREMSLFS